MKKKTVAIILVNWNQKEDLVECLISIKNNSYSVYSVILVDNNSSDDSIEEAKKINWGKMKIIRNKRNFGFAKANNIGIRKALGENYDYIMLLNTDTIIEKDAIKNIVDFFENDNEIAALSPLILFYQKKDMISYAGGIIDNKHRHFTHRGAYQIDKGQFNKPIETDFLTGCCLTIKSEVLKEVGLLDEKYFMYFEDTDLSFRLKRRHYKIFYFPEAKVWHKITDKKIFEKRFYYHYYMNRNRLFLIKKHHPSILINEISYTLSKAIYNTVRFKIVRGLAGFKGGFDFIMNKGGRL